MHSGALTRPDAIAFDCYRTLFTNSHDDWRATFGQIIEEQGLPIDAGSLWTKWRKYEVGFRASRTVLDDPAGSPPFKSYEEAWTGCFEQVFSDEEMDADAPAAGRRCVEHLGSRPIFEDTLSALQSLAGVAKLGVFSNADDASLRPLLATTGITFDAVASSESARVYKPAAAAFEHILDLLGTAPEATWYVGDHLFDDVLGAGRAGMTTVWINRTGAVAGEGDATPDVEITDLRDLAGLVSSL